MVLLKRLVLGTSVRIDQTVGSPIQYMLSWLCETEFRTEALKRFVIALCIWTIALVATYDLFLTVKYAATLDIYEMNPIGRTIMRLNYGEIHSLEPVAIFSSCKFLGTLLVIMIVQALSMFRRDWALVVSISLACFQLFLLTCFLL